MLPAWYSNPAGTPSDTAITNNIIVSGAFLFGSTYYQIKFSGAVYGTVPANGTLVSDPVAVTASSGTAFSVRLNQYSPTGVPYGSSNTGDAAVELLTSQNDKTMGGSISNNYQTGALITPIAIISRTKKASIINYTDSRGLANSGTYDLGELASWQGSTTAYIAASMSGYSLYQLATSGAHLGDLAKYASHRIIELGINDIAVGRTDAQVRADMATVIAFSPNMPTFLSTMPPETSSSDAWKTPSGQSPLQNFSISGSDARKTNNDWRRTLPLGVLGCFDIADLTEDARNSGRWVTDGVTANYATNDGIHESQGMISRIASTGGPGFLAQIHRP